MYKQLSSGIKISITRSISFAFETYMAKISWSEDKYDFNDFIAHWQQYVLTSAAWYDKVKPEVIQSIAFQEELATKINDVISKTLAQAPTEEQIATIKQLEQATGKQLEYGCKAEATFVENYLKSLQP
ncbi:hypothetical protein GCM10007425_03800 [Lysinibacillus alkalisoli]|uniref:Group-specific protein n=1 Tax=Lysinibacillus alkalisoli TaxID=1911548 RepID=A0A917FXK8_9BACI|nr:hypothetical protein [Lysinibacillus alkalisoli]GGG12683.1 hypothetical protein GCM10007425_03800 [Lysinibacillus alkalisoli]